MTTPAHWIGIRFADCAAFVNGRAYSQHELLSSGTPVLRIQNLNGGDRWYYSTLQLEPDKYCETGDLLYAWSATFGPYQYTGPRAIYHYHIWKVLSAPAFLDQSFAFYLLQKITDEVKAAAHGVAMPHMTKAGIEAWPVSIPVLAEQKRIVAKLDALTAKSRRAKEALDAIHPLIERFRQSVLAAAFRGDLTAAWREKNPDVEPADKLLARIRAERRRRWEEGELAKMRAKGKAPGDDKWKEKYEELELVDAEVLPDLPETWTWARLPDCGEMARGKSRHRPRNDPALFGGAYPFIQTGDVAQCGGRLTAFSQTYNDFGLAQSRLFPKGTVCVTIAANIANSCILDIDACFPDSVVGLTVNEKMLSPEYLEFYTRYARADLARFAPATAQKNINLEILADVAVPIPPISERIEIERKLSYAFSVADRLSRLVKEERERTELVDRAILTKAFRGELVPQDPADEPASVLLERIRAERAAAPASPRKRSPRASASRT